MLRVQPHLRVLFYFRLFELFSRHEGVLLISLYTVLNNRKGLAFFSYGVFPWSLLCIITLSLTQLTRILHFL